MSIVLMRITDIQGMRGVSLMNQLTMHQQRMR